MAQAVVQTRVVLPPISTSMPTSSWSFVHVNTGSGDGFGTDAGASALIAAVVNTMTAVLVDATHHIGWAIASSVTRSANGCHAEFTDITAFLNGARAGSPFAIAPFTLASAAGATPIPEGISFCVSRNSAYGSDPEFGPGGSRPKQSDRNRTYVGPMNGGQLTAEATTFRCVWQSTFVTQMLTWFKSLNGINGGAGTTWSLAAWSKEHAEVNNCVQLYADDRPDYQRRREEPSGIRATLALP